jgi:hypothetical protein
MKSVSLAISLLFAIHCNAQTKQPKEQPAKQMRVGGKAFEEGKTQKRTGTHQRHVTDVGMEQVIAKIPSKNAPIIIETYSKDIESITLRDEIKAYLKNKGYSNVKAITESFFEKGFKYKECSIGIFDNPQAFDIFIAPCNK